MQNNLKLVIWTLAAMIALWFIALTINRNIFSHSDIDRSILGVITINKTDVGNQCGDEYVNSNELIEYKMNNNSQIVYLCPQGYWPIQKTVIAESLTPAFRASINPLLRDKLDKYYPAAAPQTTTANPVAPAAPAPAPATTQPTATEGVPVIPQAAAGVAPVAPQPAAGETQAQQPDANAQPDQSGTPQPIQPAQVKGLFAPPGQKQAAPKPVEPAKPAQPENPFIANPAPSAPAQ